jgi:hypothetical protein
VSALRPLRRSRFALATPPKLALVRGLGARMLLHAPLPLSVAVETPFIPTILKADTVSCPLHPHHCPCSNPPPPLHQMSRARSSTSTSGRRTTRRRPGSRQASSRASSTMPRVSRPSASCPRSSSSTLRSRALSRSRLSFPSLSSLLLPFLPLPPPLLVPVPCSHHCLACSLHESRTLTWCTASGRARQARRHREGGAAEDCARCQAGHLPRPISKSSSWRALSLALSLARQKQQWQGERE